MRFESFPQIGSWVKSSHLWSKHARRSHPARSASGHVQNWDAIFIGFEYACRFFKTWWFRIFWWLIYMNFWHFFRWKVRSWITIEWKIGRPVFMVGGGYSGLYQVPESQISGYMLLSMFVSDSTMNSYSGGFCSSISSSPSMSSSYIPGLNLDLNRSVWIFNIKNNISIILNDSFKFKGSKWYLPYVQEEASKDEQGNQQSQSRIFWRKIYHATLP